MILANRAARNKSRARPTYAVSVRPILALLAGLLVFPAAASAQARRHVSLQAGATWTMPAAHVTSFSSTGPGTVDVRLTPDGQTFLVTAVRAGSTAILFLRDDGSQLVIDFEVAAAPTRPVAPGATRLHVGERTTLSARRVASYAEGVAGVVQVDVSADGLDFVITALAPGTTTLLLILEDGTQLRRELTVVP